MGGCSWCRAEDAGHERSSVTERESRWSPVLPWCSRCYTCSHQWPFLSLVFHLVQYRQQQSREALSACSHSTAHIHHSSIDQKEEGGGPSFLPYHSSQLLPALARRKKEGKNGDLSSSSLAAAGLCLPFAVHCSPAVSPSPSTSCVYSLCSLEAGCCVLCCVSLPPSDHLYISLVRTAARQSSPLFFFSFFENRVASSGRVRIQQ